MSKLKLPILALLLFPIHLLSMDSSISDEERAIQLYNTYDRDSKRKTPQQVRREYGESQSRLEQALVNASSKVRPLIQHIIDKNSMGMPEFRSILFIGPKGVGKTTLAKAIAYKTGCKCYYLPFSAFKKGYRDQTAICLKEKLDSIVKKSGIEGKVLIIIDEMNKLFENFESEHHDADNNAGTFWLFLDELIANENEDVFIIGIMNRADRIPPQIQDRHQMGHLCFAPLTDDEIKKILLDALDEAGVQLADEYSEEEIIYFVQSLRGWGARKINQLVGRAKWIFRESHLGGKIVLKKSHLLQAKQEVDVANKDHYKEDQVQETEWEQRERQFAQSQIIHLQAACNQHPHSEHGPSGLTQKGYDYITQRWISRNQHALTDYYLDDTRQWYDSMIERQKQKEEQKRRQQEADSGCVIQ